MGLFRKKRRDAERLLPEFLADAEEIDARPIPWELRATLYLLLSLLVAAVAWASLSEIERIVSARGKLITTPATMVVQPWETGVVRAINARIGQTVRKGDLLATLDATFAEADLTTLRTRFASLDAQMARAEAELAGTAFVARSPTDEERIQEQLFIERREAYKARLDQFADRITRLHAMQKTNEGDLAVLEQRARTLGDIEKMHAELVDQQSGSRLKMLERRDQRLAVERDLRAAANRVGELASDIQAAGSEREAFIREWRQTLTEELVGARRERDAVAEQLSKAARRGELVDLVAPADAVVLEVARVSVGSVVRQAEPLFTLVPLDAPLEAEVRIAARDVGFVRSGDASRLKIDAYPYMKHGVIEATLMTVSEDAFTETAPGASQGAEAYYIGRLKLGSIALRAVPADTRLIPGMTLSAEIIVGHRSVMSYFLYPLIRVFDESMREP